VVPVPLKPGGALFFAGMVPHQTPANTSPDRRRALQLHYRATSSTVMPTDKYFDIFAESDGTAASCAAAMRRGL
jgi:phytanoyl-CoA hydroxylase